jgi:hypothetical protein
MVVDLCNCFLIAAAVAAAAAAPAAARRGGRAPPTDGGMSNVCGACRSLTSKKFDVSNFWHSN